MNVMERNDELGSELRRQLRDSLNKRDLTEYNHQPRLGFRLRKALSQTTALMAFDFVVEFKQLSGTYIRPLAIRDGCVELETLPEAITDKAGMDLRLLFLFSPEYHRFNRAFDVDRIYFRSFPRILQDTNYGVAYHIDEHGRPITSIRGKV